MDLSEIKIYHDGTTFGAFIFDKNNVAIGGIAKVDISFDSTDQQFSLTLKMPKKDVNGEIIYNWDGTPVLKDIKVLAPKIHLFDARFNIAEIASDLKKLELYKKMVTPQTTFGDIIENVIEEGNQVGFFSAD